MVQFLDRGTLREETKNGDAGEHPGDLPNSRSRLDRVPLALRREKFEWVDVGELSEVARLWSEGNTMTSFAFFVGNQHGSRLGRLRGQGYPAQRFRWQREGKCGVGTFIMTVVPPFKSVTARLIMRGGMLATV